MMQTEEEYELLREGTVYQLTVSYDYCEYPLDEEGCPVMPPGAPMVYVEKAEITGLYLDGTDDPYGWWDLTAFHPGDGRDYPLLDPPMSEAELRKLDEHLADKAASAWESRYDR